MARSRIADRNSPAQPSPPFLRVLRAFVVKSAIVCRCGRASRASAGRRLRFDQIIKSPSRRFAGLGGKGGRTGGCGQEMNGPVAGRSHLVVQLGHSVKPPESRGACQNHLVLRQNHFVPQLGRSVVRQNRFVVQLDRLVVRQNRFVLRLDHSVVWQNCFDRRQNHFVVRQNYFDGLQNHPATAAAGRFFHQNRPFSSFFHPRPQSWETMPVRLVDQASLTIAQRFSAGFWGPPQQTESRRGR